MKKLCDCRVLLVDDAKANLDILVEGLKSEHKLSLALNGEMALQVAARTPPDLVLLDIMMPGLDGYEVCRRLRQMPETAEVPIMFLSSLEEVQNKTRGFASGGHAIKPDATVAGSTWGWTWRSVPTTRPCVCKSAAPGRAPDRAPAIESMNVVATMNL